MNIFLFLSCYVVMDSCCIVDQGLLGNSFSVNKGEGHVHPSSIVHTLSAFYDQEPF